MDNLGFTIRLPKHICYYISKHVFCSSNRFYYLEASVLLWEHSTPHHSEDIPQSISSQNNTHLCNWDPNFHKLSWQGCNSQLIMLVMFMQFFWSSHQLTSTIEISLKHMPPRHDRTIKNCLSKYGDFEEVECQWESKRERVGRERIRIRRLEWRNTPLHLMTLPAVAAKLIAMWLSRGGIPWQIHSRGGSPWQQI